ncbi:H(+)/Cl(-) exchange transporter ClcA [Legionella qingyii]|uniref:H(+)/Cl(-) exchange transporter ClcA n=1 Tax=Legionella qingyii TaxID=2184757 RepID=A0A317U4L9_9GAMM|nr:H(+)/Cl(-) exchange transporter ClcA [Legionella qingyii]PWY56205.1 H(+)/Cl(-) exchange transporter ClcA [Legionella qingyii]RUR22233.1 H(+)/Cl(-) exchange transporter ClcA [Legionella qingyii]RUR25775.1 H(+)/Cl(-) exchange transporter ClcA [Legionella qingyii]
MRNKILMLYAVSFVLGIVVGLVGSTFRLSIDVLGNLLHNFFQFLSLHGWPAGLISGLVSMVMVYAAYFAVKHYAPQASGSGVPEIEGTLLHLKTIVWHRLLPIKFVFGILALSAQMILGREGPTIHIGGSLGEMLGGLFNLTRRRRDSLIASGAAAGLAVAFNAPLAGVIFVMEEMRNQFNYSFTSFSMVVICCITATVILDLIIGPQPTIPMNVFEFPHLDSLWLFALFGIVVGFVGLLFNLSLIKTLTLLDKLTSRQKSYYVLIVGFLIGYIAVYHPAAVGGGMHIIHQALTMSPGFGLLCFLLVVRFIGTMACYGTSVPGGIFAPILAIGTLLGLAIFHILEMLHIDFLTQPGMFAIAGMAALFASSTRSPITGAVLVVEMTHNYYLIFPVMMACITATIVLQLTPNEPIYEQLLNRALRLDAKNLSK